jgi:hypothetical protein
VLLTEWQIYKTSVLEVKTLILGLTASSDDVLLTKSIRNINNRIGFIISASYADQSNWIKKTVGNVANH